MFFFNKTCWAKMVQRLFRMILFYVALKITITNGKLATSCKAGCKYLVKQPFRLFL